MKRFFIMLFIIIVVSLLGISIYKNTTVTTELATISEPSATTTVVASSADLVMYEPVSIVLGDQTIDIAQDADLDELMEKIGFYLDNDGEKYKIYCARNELYPDIAIAFKYVEDLQKYIMPQEDPHSAAWTAYKTERSSEGTVSIIDRSGAYISSVCLLGKNMDTPASQANVLEMLYDALQNPNDYRSILKKYCTIWKTEVTGDPKWKVREESEWSFGSWGTNPQEFIGKVITFPTNNGTGLKFTGFDDLGGLEEITFCDRDLIITPDSSIEKYATKELDYRYELISSSIADGFKLTSYYTDDPNVNVRIEYFFRLDNPGSSIKIYNATWFDVSLLNRDGEVIQTKTSNLIKFDKPIEFIDECLTVQHKAKLLQALEISLQNPHDIFDIFRTTFDVAFSAPLKPDPSQQEQTSSISIEESETWAPWGS